MKRDGNEQLERLRATLERYGANQERWPVNVRTDLAELLSDDAAAQQLHREFAALDDVLHTAPALSKAPPNQELVQRILDSIAVPADGGRDATVVDLDRRRAPVSFRPPWHRQVWPNVATAGALAASLMLGITVGATGAVDDVVAPAAQVLGLSDEDTSLIAYSDPELDVLDTGAIGTGAFEEDLL